MSFRLDHIVLAVGDLERAVADYRGLGFTVQPGGRHPGRTSHNALVVFEDGAYLELIAWGEAGPAERWYNEHAKHGDGFMDFALIPDDVPRAVADAKSRGLMLKGPIEGGRVRPDGEELQWQTARQATFDLPFLCGDVTPRELRVPTGNVRRHANGSIGIATVSVAVRDIEASVGRYEALLGSRAPTPFVLPGCDLRMAAIALDGTSIALVSPMASSREPYARELAQRLSARGEGPCALAIGSSTVPATTRLDRKRAHDALIELLPA